MACRLYERTATSTILVLLIVLDTMMMCERASAAPAKRNDILAGTEFLSVFINGAMASTPRRRGFRRGGHVVQDNVVSESRQSEASIYRISRAPSNSRPTTQRPTHREVAPRLYPISHKSINHQQSFAPVVDDPGVTDDLLKSSTSARANGTKPPGRPVNRKVIGVSVTSSVEATPYKVRVEHYDNGPVIMVTRPPVESSETSKSSAMITTVGTTIKTATSSTTTMSPTSRFTSSSSPAPVRLVTEELNNVVSESNRSEFSVDEDSPKTNWRTGSSVTPGQLPAHSVPFSTTSRDFATSSGGYRGLSNEGLNAEPAERGYEVSEINSEPAEIHEEPSEHSETGLRGRKAGRGYDTSVFNQPPKVYPQPSKIYGKPAEMYSVPAKVYGEPSKIYSEPEKIYGEPSKIYSEPAKVYGEPAKMYSEPAKIYSEPAKIYSEPEKIYSEPAKIYSEPAKIYSEPSKFYSEPSKIYHSNGESIDREPVEQNYEADEAVSVGTNGNVHGPQTESPNTSDSEDGHKVSYVVEGRKYRKYRVEERTPDGFIVGEYGVVSNDDGSLRGVRYTADGTINPRLIYETLMKFLAL